MNIIALDYGRKRIGVAWVDTGINVVLPLGVIEHADDSETVEKVMAVISKEKPDRIVIGLPVTLDGSENENTQNIRQFAASLMEHTRQQNIVFFDERFSSQQADRSSGGASRDEKAAMVILEGYLESVKHK